jgi:hypothetical protein
MFYFFGSFFLACGLKKKENCPGSMLQVYTKTGGSFLKVMASEGAPACRLPQRTGILPDFMDVLPVFSFFNLNFACFSLFSTWLKYAPICS